MVDSISIWETPYSDGPEPLKPDEPSGIRLQKVNKNMDAAKEELSNAFGWVSPHAASPPSISVF